MIEPVYYKVLNSVLGYPDPGISIRARDACSDLERGAGAAVNPVLDETYEHLFLLLLGLSEELTWMS